MPSFSPKFQYFNIFNKIRLYFCLVSREKTTYNLFYCKILNLFFKISTISCATLKIQPLANFNAIFLNPIFMFIYWIFIIINFRWFTLFYSSFFHSNLLFLYKILHKTDLKKSVIDLFQIISIVSAFSMP